MTAFSIGFRASLKAVALGALCGTLLHATCVRADASSIDEHAAHRAAAGSSLHIAKAEYRVPDVTLEDEHGRPVRLRQILASDQALVVNFIFTSCATVCPVMTATLLQLQRELKDASPAPRYISVSIDPDYDTANILNDYAKRSHADWTFLSGERESVLEVLRAFGAWRGGKSNHIPLTLLRRPGETQWTRVEGLTSARKLAELWRDGVVASDAGRTLYRDGVGADRRPVAAVVQGDVDSSSAALACANCHKRSGLGTSEGRNRVPPLTATALFGSGPGGGTTLPARLTRVYDDEAVRRAIMLGIGADGRELAPFMPRYQLADADAAALIAYLHTLGTVNATQGVSATDVNLVTIVADTAPAAEREAVVGVLSRFAAIKNSGTRRESERAAASRRQLYGERHIRGYRHWNFQVWTLTGGPETWSIQLEQRYAAAPPFAVLSGAVGDDWAAVHAFCERHELPCIMPVTSVPGDATQNHYNVYYSEGALTQARVTARDLLGEALGSRDRLLLLHMDDKRGRAARAAFELAWRAGGGTGIRVHMTPAGAAPSIQEWRDVLKKHRPEILIAWMDPEQLGALAAAANDMEDGPRRIYTAEDFTSWQGLELPNPLGERVRHVYPYRLPAPGRAQFPREDVWLHTQKLDALARVPAAKALFACHATGEALAEMADNYSRDYLIETLEHMLDGTNMTTLYPLTTLGTGQRFLAKGAYVARPGRGDTSGLFTEGRWVQL